MRLLTHTVLILAAALWAGYALAAQTRTWTDSSGDFQIEAQLVEVNDGTVHLKKADGQIVTVPLDRLSAADRQFIERQVAASNEAGSPVEGGSTEGMRNALVELSSGAKVEGRITARDENSVTIETTRGERTYSRKYKLSQVAAITIDGARDVPNQAEGAGGTSSGRADEVEPGKPAALGIQRTEAQIERLIERLGREPPDWFDSVQVDYPRTLDLSWPQPPPPPWDSRKNVGQYIWDVINPNPGKWKSGIVLMHFLLKKHERDAAKSRRAMNELGRMYQDLLQDYARAAFWRRMAEADKEQSPGSTKLAECYWKLGNKQMAMDLLNRMPAFYPTIKLLADMGETQRAVQLAESGARGGMPDLAYLYAGDACRMAGRHDEALEYYQKVVALRAVGKPAERIKRNQIRARANIEGIRLFESLDLSRVADGSYRAASPGYAGLLEIEVTVSGGRIQSVKVTGHQEKQFYSSIDDTTRKIVQKQDVKGIDTTSGATITSEAIIYATAKALAGGIR